MPQLSKMQKHPETQMDRQNGADMKIYNVPQERRYWVIRAESGIYYEHFLKYGIIALGHIDELGLPEEKPFFPEISYISSKLQRLHDAQELKRRRTFAHVNQVKTFLQEMNIGDWVITIGEHSLSFGRITGYPELNKKPLPILHEKDAERRVDLHFNLRRAVAWGPLIQRGKLPFGLMQSLRANQALFNIDHHREAIYHTLYPAFTMDNKLYLSAKINTEDGISNYAITSLLSILNEIEVMAKELGNGISAGNFDNFFEKYAHENIITIKTKAQFHSPGDIWNEILSIARNIDTWMFYAVAGYSMIFGNTKLGFDGLIDLATRQKIWDIVIDRMEKKNVSGVVGVLKLTIPELDTSKLEIATNDDNQLIN